MRLTYFYDPLLNENIIDIYFDLRFEKLFHQAQSEVDRARHLAVSSESASDWVHALPIPSLGLHLDPTALKIACSLRLGSNICQPHQCICGVMVEKSGLHGLACKKQVGRHSRHNEINDLVKRALVSAKIPARTEPPGLFRTDGKRLDRMTQFAWKKGKSLVWDVTVADTVCATYVTKCSKSPCAAAETRETSKKSKYKHLTDYCFIPIAIETFGAWGSEGLKLIKDIGKKLKEVTGNNRSTFYLTQQISMAIQRGNSSCIFGTIPDSEGLDQVFDFIDFDDT